MMKTKLWNKEIEVKMGNWTLEKRFYPPCVFLTKLFKIVDGKKVLALKSSHCRSQQQVLSMEKMNDPL